MWFIGVEVEQETSAALPKKNPGSAPGIRRPDSVQLLVLLLKSWKGEFLSTVLC